MYNKEELENIIAHVKEPLLVQHRYSEEELENMPISLLKEHGFYPETPNSLVDIEMFAETIADVIYTDLPDGYLGMTEFGYHKRPIIYISNKLSSPRTEEEFCKLRFVFAHECGHVIMQNHLYEQACDRYKGQSALYAVYPETPVGIAGKRHAVFYKDYSNYRWYEWQANTAGAHLLMPSEHLNNVILTCLNNEIRKPTAWGRVSPAWLLYKIYNALKSVFRVSQATAEIATERYLKARPTLINDCACIANHLLGYN